MKQPLPRTLWADTPPQPPGAYVLYRWPLGDIYLFFQVNATCKAILEAGGHGGSQDNRNRQIIMQIVAGFKVTQSGCLEIHSEPGGVSYGWVYQVLIRCAAFYKTVTTLESLVNV